MGGRSKMSFNKWKDEYGLEFEPNYSKETELDCKAAFEAGQQSRQAEIDKLQKRIKELELINLDSELRFDASKECIDELQKQVDEIVNEIKIVELKILKCEPNSIMGVHWSSKLAGLKRELKNAK